MGSDACLYRCRGVGEEVSTWKAWMASSIKGQDGRSEVEAVHGRKEV